MKKRTQWTSLRIQAPSDNQTTTTKATTVADDVIVAAEAVDDGRGGARMEPADARRVVNCKIAKSLEAINGQSRKCHRMDTCLHSQLQEHIGKTTRTCCVSLALKKNGQAMLIHPPAT